MTLREEEVRQKLQKGIDTRDCEELRRGGGGAVC